MRDGFLPLFLLTTTCIAAPADSLKATFGGGVLGIPWGATLASVVGTYPQGDHVFAVTPGCREHVIQGGAAISRDTSRRERRAVRDGQGEPRSYCLGRFRL